MAPLLSCRWLRRKMPVCVGERITRHHHDVHCCGSYFLHKECTFYPYRYSWMYVNAMQMFITGDSKNHVKNNAPSSRSTFIDCRRSKVNFFTKNVQFTDIGLPCRLQLFVSVLRQYLRIFYLMFSTAYTIKVTCIPLCEVAMTTPVVSIVH